MHTPTPWTLDIYHGPHGDSAQIRNEKACIASVNIDLRGGVGVPTQDDNAAFIVQACNAHDALVAALTDLYDVVGNTGLYAKFKIQMDAASAALALAAPKEAVR